MVHIQLLLVWCILCWFCNVFMIAISPANDVDMEELLYNDAGDLKLKLKKIRKEKNAAQSAGFESISEQELQDLKKSELSLKSAVLRASVDHGEFSVERANALHAYGRNLYKQGKHNEVFQVSKEIVKIHEEIDGPEHVTTAKALANVGVVAFRIGDKQSCQNAMYRALYILIKTYGPESKEVLLHRGQMLTFQVDFAETTEGLSYEDYFYEL